MNMLDQQTVEATSLSVFKNWSNKIRHTDMGFFVTNLLIPWSP